MYKLVAHPCYARNVSGAQRFLPGSELGMKCSWVKGGTALQLDPPPKDVKLDWAAVTVVPPPPPPKLQSWSRRICKVEVEGWSCSDCSWTPPPWSCKVEVEGFFYFNFVTLAGGGGELQSLQPSPTSHPWAGGPTAVQFHPSLNCTEVIAVRPPRRTPVSGDPPTLHDCNFPNLKYVDIYCIDALISKINWYCEMHN